MDFGAIGGRCLRDTKCDASGKNMPRAHARAGSSSHHLALASKLSFFFFSLHHHNRCQNKAVKHVNNQPPIQNSTITRNNKESAKSNTSRQPFLLPLLPLHTNHYISLSERFGNSRLLPSLFGGMPLASLIACTRVNTSLH